MTGVTFGPDEDARYDTWRDDLVADFDRFVQPFGLALDASDLGLLLDWKRSYGNGRLGRWRRVELEEFLLAWCPAKLSATAEEVQTLPVTVGLAMKFLAARGLLERGSDGVDELSEHAAGLHADFLTEMDNPANFGMAKSLFAGLDLDGDDLSPETVEAAIARFNSLPDEERRALTGGDAPGYPTRDIVVGPVTLPEEETLRSAALDSPVLQAFLGIADYCATPGRTLTKAGNLKLVDARALVELLDTGDVFREPGDDDWRGSTRSAAQLPVLDHWKWWASEAGVLRKRQGRLVAVDAWRKRVGKDPLHELLDALHLLANVGPLRSVRWWFSDPIITALDASLGPLLGRLATSPDGADYDEVVQDWQSMLQRLNVPEWWPGQGASYISLLVEVLERVGVAVHREAQASTTTIGSSVRSGGVVTLTPVGFRFAVELLRNQGVTVEVVPEPRAQTVGGLVTLAADVDPELWWTTTLGWLDAQVDQPAALQELLTELERAEDPALLLLILDPALDQVVDRLVPAMRRLARPGGDPSTDDLAMLAAEWLHRHGELGADQINEDALATSRVIALGRLAVSAPELVIEALTATPSSDAYAFVQLIGQLLPRYAVELLEVIGQHHPDKGVAKAARKQLFRTRSRLVQQGRTADDRTVRRR